MYKRIFTGGNKNAAITNVEDGKIVHKNMKMKNNVRKICTNKNCFKCQMFTNMIVINCGMYYQN